MTTVVAEVVKVFCLFIYMPIEAGLESIDMETDFPQYLPQSGAKKKFYHQICKIIS